MELLYFIFIYFFKLKIQLLSEKPSRVRKRDVSVQELNMSSSRNNYILIRERCPGLSLQMPLNYELM